MSHRLSHGFGADMDADILAAQAATMSSLSAFVGFATGG